MPVLRNLKALLLQEAQQTELDVATADFTSLEIRGADDAFHYFYDRASQRLIKTFVLKKGRSVDTLCDVFLIKKSEGFTPRLVLWKKDKTNNMPDTLTEEELVTEGRTVLMKARVDLNDCQETFWRLIDFLKACRGIDIPGDAFRLVDSDSAALARALEGHDKKAVLEAVRIRLQGQLTEQDVQMLVDRRNTLVRFRNLLSDVQYFMTERDRLRTTEEGVWQAFFEEDSWIFGYGLTLVACEKYDDSKLEQVTTGANVFTGGGKRSDAVLRTKGFVQSLLFGEIKTHRTPLLMESQYRKPDVYQVSQQLSGAVSQVQKTAHKAIRGLADLHQARDAAGKFRFEVSTIMPRQVVVAGMLNQLVDDGQINEEKLSSFDLYRRDHQSVEIITFDELYERARFIVESQESPFHLSKDH